MSSVTLTNCDQEPIHIPSAIQPHGALLVCTEGTLAVERASANLESFLGVAAEKAIGQRVDSFFSEPDATSLRVAAVDPSPRVRGSIVMHASNGKVFDAILHRSGNSLVVELEPNAGDLVGYHPALRETVARFQATSSVMDLCAIAAVQVRTLTQFDRVMIYRFDADWNGEVIAEDKREDLETFLGHHYPASDIPTQARRLYTINWLRLIPDVAYRPCPLVPDSPPGGAPLDMSHSVLRSVSPIHCEYLGNMGVRASMSISLLRDGKLWGLIACHHYAGPKPLTFALRDSAEFLGQTLSWVVATREHAIEAQRERDSQRVESDLVRGMTASENFLEGLAVPALLQVVEADGAAVIFEDQVRLIGSTPTETVVRNLADWLRDELVDDLCVTDNLGARAKFLDEQSLNVASGLLAVAISRNHPEFVIWFRASTERVISWAGNPNKVVDKTAPRLSPRGSFALWVETVRGRSLPWQPWELEAASNIRRALLGGVRRRAAELREIADKFAEADRLKDSFLASVSHELRTPLNAIAGWARILRTRQSPDQYTHALDVIERNASAQTQLIEDLLDVSRMTTGKLSLDAQPLDLATVIYSALEAVSLSAESRAIRLRPVIDARSSIIVGDPRRLQQVIWNLVTNAIKFTPKGGHVDIVLRRVSSDVEVTVADNGQGISAALLPYVFESFRQGDSKDRRGLGLGLAISKHIVELHGGTIVAESAGVGHGATLRVRLPVSSVQATAREAEAPKFPEVDTMMEGVRILVVEDEPDSRDLLVTMLSIHGAIVTPFGNAIDALAALSTTKPDIILSDIGLPDVDGHEFMHRVRSLPADAGGAIPSVAITAFARPRDRALALTAGFQSYVAKPLDPEELIAVIRSLLGHLTPTTPLVPVKA